MASHRRPKQPSRLRVTVLTATAAAAVVVSANGASAAPQPSKDEAKAKVDTLYTESEQAVEKANGAKERQDKLEKEIGQIQDQVAKGQDELNTLRNALGSMASAQYRSGGIDSSMALFLSANPDEYLDKASTLEQLSGKQVEAVQKIQAKQRTLAQQRQEASGKLADLDATRKELNEKKKTAQDKLSAAQAVLNSLSADDRAKLSDQEKRASSGDADKANAGGGAKGSGRAGQALEYAKTQLGDAYHMGDTGPDSWDCSGLVQWAYGQAGVDLPRVTNDQANAGRHLSLSELQPGDLILFYGDLHHVGLYAGNGMTLHASNPRGGVKYEAVRNMPFQFGVRVGG
ncbi:C40 family peptidase [Streptomyces sp. G-G2]|uniref:C40 family peptidase n=1 Tax=Streptomyces sp. G-G2 TaxID=3046201 RepID=UPI0024BB8125|nr:C40 family peptidase [Streptomyces sp. G-G2]MDJ0383323.1 NlpC/P60 family protein [Streptomyces sp. G-G2]